MRTTTYLPADCPAFLDVAGVAELLRVHPRTIARRIAAGQIATVRTAGATGCHRIPREELERFLSGPQK
jgi:excisionase family DNA binding protein